MSAAPQLPSLWTASSRGACQGKIRRGWEECSTPDPVAVWLDRQARPAPPVSVAFYRKHTESTLRRYLYASMQVGRTPSILGDPVGRGWASSRTVKTFEDALIFVLDVEKCLARLDPLERMILSRIVLQDYTQAEVAGMLQMSPRTIGYKFCEALDSLTEKLLKNHLLMIPD